MSQVVITGAGSGLGRAAAHRFASAGWRCILVDHDAAALARVFGQITAASAAASAASGGDGGHQHRRIDLTAPGEVASLATVEGPIDAVINNAGRSDASGQALVDQPPLAQAALHALNLKAPAAVVTALAPRLVPNARIVNVSSGAGLRAIPLRGWYSATKAGLIAQSTALSRARPDWIVTVLCPGFVRTELVEQLIAAGRLDPAQAVSKTPLGRMAQPAELADALLFLASAAASPIRGQVLRVCGGSSVYGGSQPCPQATARLVPIDARTAVSVIGGADGSWRRAIEAQMAGRLSPAAAAYPAILDVGPMQHAGTTALLEAIQSSARAFARTCERDASLTFVLPSDDEPSAGRTQDWAQAGAGAAARMLVATLACELATRALRVNAISIVRSQTPERVAPLLEYLMGARAQFVTGQTVRANAA